MTTQAEKRRERAEEYAAMIASRTGAIHDISMLPDMLLRFAAEIEREA